MGEVIDRPGAEEQIGDVLLTRVITDIDQRRKETARGNAVEIHQTAPAPAASESTAIIQMIERAALNPNVDIDKMERLLEMQERIMARNAKTAFDAAFAGMQQDLPVINERGGIKDRNGNVQSRYALWEDINEAIKPILAKHGFGISFRTGKRDGHIVVTGVLSHAEGHREETEMELPTDTSGSKNAVQAVGSSTSYGKRYTASALLNLTSRGEDDDGAASNAAKTITEKQVLDLRDLIAEVGADEQRFLSVGKLDRLEDMLATQYDKAVQWLRDFQSRGQQRARA